MRFVDAVRVAHRGLDVELLDLLLVLLEQRDEEVNGHVNVGQNLLLGQLDVADGDAEAHSLLQLEFDCRPSSH